MTAVMVAVASMVLAMTCGVLLGLALVSGHTGMRLFPGRRLSPTGQG